MNRIPTYGLSMESIRKWFCRPKKDDKSLLAQFFFADEALNMIASELDSFDGRKDPERCTALVNQLRGAQDKVLTIINVIMDVLIGDERANRDFRVKFPEDVLQENLAGQLWFGAECLAAGSSIMNRETESAEMRPLAKALTKTLENVRNLLREACLRNNTPNGPLKLNNDELITEMLIESLKIFDRLFAEFELSYVSAMVPVKTTQEYELQELIGILFSETLHRALKMNLLTQEMIDDYDPALMFTIPRLAIVSGLLVFPDGPLCIDKPIEEMSEMFRPFRTLLHKIRELLWTLNKRELFMLEKLLCDNEQITDVKSLGDMKEVNSDLDEFVNRFYKDYPTCKDYISNFYTVTVNPNDQANADLGKDATEPEKPENNLENVISKTENINIPSTSTGYLTSTSTHENLIDVAGSENSEVRSESLPDSDCLEVVSAKLSSILLTKEVGNPAQKNTINNSEIINKIKKPLRTINNSHKNKNKEKPLIENLDSPDDSGICTENTSLDRSPSFDNDNCNCDNLKNNCSELNLKKCTYNISKRTVNNVNSNDKVSVNRKSDSAVAVSVLKSNVVLTNGETVGRTVINTVLTNNCCDENLLLNSNNESDTSSDTSSFNSNCADDEEIALAIQAAEIANRNELRSRFRSSEDMIHRLFVCIAGVADQLQTNFASDLRNILKSVFLIHATNTSENTLENSSIEYHPTENEVIENEFSVDPNILAQEALFDSNVYFHVNDENSENGETSEFQNRPRNNDEEISNFTEVVNDFLTIANSNSNGINQPSSSENEFDRPPIWIPDDEAPKCMSCSANFTVVKRRHHCRNCGKVFCSRCSSNSIPLPKFGHNKPVRVCNKCFMYQLTPFTM